MTSGPTGYSGTPLAKKLGIRAGSRLLAIDPPRDYRQLLAPLPMGLLDIKVCAVSAVWSGLKLVLRKELRHQKPEK